MFTIDQINEIHDTLGKATTLPAYLNALKAIGVVESVSFVTDGHTEHLGADGYVVSTPPAHQTFTIAEVSDRRLLTEALKETNYEKMSKALADSGIEKWIFDTHALTIAYLDKAANVLLKEDVR
ncbi:DUF1398 family protein [Kribbella jiaozuonensis]|uniref:DUF1398 domain-containing protein n=1 Tax=Kribbella jiaozuonensis TaxID=2575441 RepID=A0A4U3LQB2_9ACTN|nr:DUF1398 family protein [Kribbella jiaozuonensis]TKK76776.1 DUF1398 domain-containing protein [Kribbella jiaozuonensis]